MTARVLHYTKLGNRTMPTGELWVAIVSGSPGKGGDGVVIYGTVDPLVKDSVTVLPAMEPGGAFKFSANRDYDESKDVLTAEREVWGLDAVPPHIAAAWLQQLHLGNLTP
jgi:hypothetical protein